MIEINSKTKLDKQSINFTNKELNKNGLKEKNYNDIKKTSIKIISKEQLLRAYSYGEIVPSKCELNCDAPLIPYQYQKSFNIKKISNQETIGNIDNFCFSFYSKKQEENSSYMKIYPPPHILL